MRLATPLQAGRSSGGVVDFRMRPEWDRQWSTVARTTGADAADFQQFGGLGGALNPGAAV